MYFLNSNGTLDNIENYTGCDKSCMCAGCCYKKGKSNKLLQVVFVIIILYIIYKLYKNFTSGSGSGSVDIKFPSSITTSV